VLDFPHAGLHRARGAGAKGCGVIEWIGVVAGLMTTTAFVPQVLQTWRTRSARDFALPMLLLFVGGILLWLVYGLAIGSAGLIVANGITLPLAGYILWVKLRTG
jgi:MtN3 and saliva related transmembrane protein